MENENVKKCSRVLRILESQVRALSRMWVGKNREGAMAAWQQEAEVGADSSAARPFRASTQNKGTKTWVRALCFVSNQMLVKTLLPHCCKLGEENNLISGGNI